MIHRWCFIVAALAALAAPLHAQPRLDDRLAQTRAYGLTVEFEPAAAEPLPGKHGGSLSEFTFKSAATQDALARVGATRMERIFPDFRPEDRFTRNGLGEPVVLEDLSRFYNVMLDSKDIDAAAAQLRGVAGIRALSVSRPGRLMSVPNDPDFIYQWWLNDTNDPVQDQACTGSPYITDVDINGPEAWDITTGVSSVRVGVLDSGIENTHPDLNGGVELGPRFSSNDYAPPSQCQGTPTCCEDSPVLSCNEPLTFDSYDTMYHGTGVAGIIGARQNNGIGVSGAAPGVTLVSCKVSSPCNALMLPCWSAEAINYAATASPPIMIMNMSYGFGDEDPAERAAAKNAFLLGRLLVASMGNDDQSLRRYPAAYERFVCAVGAVEDSGSRWSDSSPTVGLRGSNFGSWIDLSAPGGDKIVTTRLSTVTGSYYYTCSDGFGGTSSAAPTVAGVAALLLSAHPELEGEDLQQVMGITARDITIKADLGWDIYTGAGLVRADQALQFLASPRQIRHDHTNSMSEVIALTTPVQMQFYGVSGLQDGHQYVATRHLMRGTINLPPSFVSAPAAWVRSSGTLGARDTNVYDEPREAPYGRITSVSASQIEVETYVYEVALGPNNTVWVPVNKQDATVAITAVGGEPDDVPPGTITLNGDWVSTTRVGLFWTAPGDDGNVGTAKEYDLRYSTAPITDATWYSQNRAATPRPSPAGTIESVTISHLTKCTRYYFAIKAIDQAGNIGAISNVPTARTLCGPGNGATEERDEAPAALELRALGVRPGGGPTMLHYGIPAEMGGQPLELAVFDAAGRRVKALARMAAEPGWFVARWDRSLEGGGTAGPGVYFARLRVGDAVRSRVVVVLTTGS